LKPTLRDKHNCITRRAPRGARGLKPHNQNPVTGNSASRPARGAWIETGDLELLPLVVGGRAPRGARGLKPNNNSKQNPRKVVAPRAGRVD